MTQWQKPDVLSCPEQVNPRTVWKQNHPQSNNRQRKHAALRGPSRASAAAQGRETHVGPKASPRGRGDHWNSEGPAAAEICRTESPQENAAQYSAAVISNWSRRRCLSVSPVRKLCGAGGRTKRVGGGGHMKSSHQPGNSVSSNHSAKAT